MDSTTPVLGVIRLVAGYGNSNQGVITAYNGARQYCPSP
jgi:hypothetical protein